MLLNWDDNGTCTNPPDGWAVTVGDSAYGPGWRFCASRDSGFGGIDHQGYPTARAAQLAAEAALVRLGVVPLPEWTAPTNRAENSKQMRLLEWRARVDHFDGWRFQIWDITAPAGGVQSIHPLPTAQAAQAAAERHLRAELAAWLDAEAAKEGGR